MSGRRRDHDDCGQDRDVSDKSLDASKPGGVQEDVSLSSPATDKAQSLYGAGLDDLLAFFSQPDLTIAQAEELLSHVHDERPQLVERLISWLEEAGPFVETALLSTPSPIDAEAPTSTDLSVGLKHDVALVLLTYLGDRAVVPRLRALVQEAQASDEFKLKLISVIHDLEPQQDSHALLDHLRYPGKAMQQSHLKHLQRLASPLERSFWLELMAEDMSADARISFARSSAEVDDLAAVPVLVCMCYDPDEKVALAAMDAVERYKDARALPALRELARHHPHQRVREGAQKAANRLGVRAPLSPQVEPVPMQPLFASYLTTIHGSGEQAAVFVRRLPIVVLEAQSTVADPTPLNPTPIGFTPVRDACLRLVQVWFNDGIGVEQCFGLDVHEDDLQDVLRELDTQGLVPVPVPYEQAMIQLDRACAWTWQAGQLLPLSFIAWREWIRGPWSDPEQPVSDARYGAGEILPRLRGPLLETCHGLLYQDAFVGWGFETPAVHELGDRYLHLVQKEGEPLAADVMRALLQQGVEQIVTPTLRSQIQARLYRVAPLLRELYEEDEVWQWAVVAADALRQGGPIPLQAHPLLLGLVGFGLQSVLDREIDWSIAL